MHLAALIVKDGAAFSSPLRSQKSRFLIPNKTHRKAVLLITEIPSFEYAVFFYTKTEI